MNNMAIKLLGSVALAGLLGCVHSGGEPRVKVYKGDGAIQCEGTAITLAAMQASLDGAGVTVFCAQKAHNGLMQIAMCGAAAGSINVYTIAEAQLAQAEALGFSALAGLPSYVDEPCEPPARESR